MTLRDGFLLSLGTLTRIPVPPPAVVDRTTGGVAMLAAPVTVLPLGAGVAVVLALGHLAGAPALLSGLLAAAFLAWATRLLHLDGVSDTVDGLTASTDRERSLEVMRSGTAGPAGVVTLVVILGVQTLGFASLSGTVWGTLLAGAAVCWSRVALAVACARGVPAARPGGLGAAVAGSVRGLRLALLWVPVTAVWWVVADRADAGVGGWVAPLLSTVAVVACVRLAVRRLGGVTGDVLGACVEAALL
ncbi:MAG: adenosylcobinamide-GDP ribazoletransferase, partial [Nocardioides sp.]|uniref:adenosylcobinamide-GDP ribazoletransferase n=1 Tax=Nocardioides sp. TaxID=35761 RepID=UPI003F06E1EB